MGLGIAEFTDTIKEGSLEWIQVHPDYQLPWTTSWAIPRWSTGRQIAGYG